MNGNNPIGVLDSGVGGLTVAKKIIDRLPGERIIYFGDTGRIPYGNKSKDIITEYSMQIVRFLLEKNVKLIVIACNTICANSYDDLRDKFQIPVFEVISLASADYAKSIDSGAGKVGVVATEATVRSGAYERELHKINENIQVIQKACPYFVPLAEKGLAESRAGDYMCDHYLYEFKNAGLDALILGCTHFPLFHERIAATLPAGIRVIDPADSTAEAVEGFLADKRLQADKNCLPPSRKHEFYVSGNADAFNPICENLLGIECNAEKIDISKY